MRWYMENRKIGVRQTGSYSGTERHDKTQGTVGKVWKRMSRIDGKRRQNRIKGAIEKVFEKALLLTAHLLRPNQMNPFRGQMRQYRIDETQMLFLDKLVGSLRNSR